MSRLFERLHPDQALPHSNENTQSVDSSQAIIYTYAAAVEIGIRGVSAFLYECQYLLQVWVGVHDGLR